MVSRSGRKRYLAQFVKKRSLCSNLHVNLERIEFTRKIASALLQYPVVALLGPRQSGKTTLAREFALSGQVHYPGDVNYFDLEDPDAILRLSQPKLALSPLTGLVVIDEVQRHPDLFPILRAHRAHDSLTGRLARY